MLSKEFMKTSRGMIIHALPPNDEYHHYDNMEKKIRESKQVIACESGCS